MDSNIKNVFNNVFSHISDLNKSKEIVKEWFQNFLMKVKNDQEHLTLVSHLVTKILRMVYQENLAVYKIYYINFSFNQLVSS
jgi:hypothetical protein